MEPVAVANPGRPGSGGPAASRGFSLLEILVAFSVLALSIGVLMQVFSGSLRNLAVMDGYSDAVEIADGRMALVGNEVPAQPGYYEGTEGGYCWSITFNPIQLAELPALQNNLALLHVAVRVQWASGDGDRSFELESLRFQTQQAGG